jgi:cysteine-rich repeat protein
VCGDSTIGTTEDCDDGNTAKGDGCGADCLIESGFTCTGQPSTCVDVDECLTNADNCDANAACVNIPGSFLCSCNPGYAGDGVTCADVDECAQNTDNCDANAACANSPGSFSCACNPGFTGDGLACADVDECAQNTDNCDVNAVCANAPGSFSCACNPGYAGSGVTCADVDECAQNTDNCSANAACSNSPGSFSCACNAGFTGNGVMCADIDECAQNTDNCSANAACSNAPGSFSCACNPGYTGNGVMCSDVDECALGFDNCDANAACSNAPGSFSCACNAGYMGNGVSCADIDECAIGTDNCAVNATCTNTPGAFSCACNPPSMGNGVTCSGSFNGQFGASWEELADPLEYLYGLMTFHPAGLPLIYNMYDATGQSYNPATDTWSHLANVAPFNHWWASMAPVGGKLYMIRNNSVYSYNPPTDTWATLANVVGGDDFSMTESDEFGHVFGYVKSGNIVDYNTATGTVTYYPTGTGAEYETRMGYDPQTRAIFFGAYDTPVLYRMDLTTKAVTQMASIPESQLNDIFCSDRSGHIYVAGDLSGTTIFQYDIATNTYKLLPALPSNHGNNGTCTVSETGWLYVGTGSEGKFYRIQLF